MECSANPFAPRDKTALNTAVIREPHPGEPSLVSTRLIEIGKLVVEVPYETHLDFGNLCDRRSLRGLR